MTRHARRSARSGPRPARGGFTLLELLVATSVLVVLGGALVVVLRGGVTTWRRSEARRESFEVAQAVLGQLGEDLLATTIEPETGYGGRSVDAIFLGDSDEDSRSRLALVRTIRGESESPITGHAGSAIGADARIDSRDDLKKALDHRLRATGGLCEVAWLMGKPGAPDGEVLFRGYRTPIGGRTSFFASEKNFFRAPLAGLPAPKTPPPEGIAYCREIARRVLHFELLYATPYTDTWSTDVPPRKATKESGPLVYWDSTRGILAEKDKNPKIFTTFLDAASRANPQDDILPARVKVTLVVREAPAAQSTTLLLRELSASAKELVVADPGRLPPEGGFVYVERDGGDPKPASGEWIEYDRVVGDRVSVVARGARATKPTDHAAGADVTVGRTFEAVLPIPSAREDWGDR